MRAVLHILATLCLLACSRPDGPLIGGARIPIPRVPPSFSLPTVLLAVTGGDQSASLRWEATAKHEYAVYTATTRSGVFAGAALSSGLTKDRITVTGLTNGQRVFFGLGMRRRGSLETYVPAGPAVAVRPSAPIYVDAAASASGADGKTPGTAFPKLEQGILAAALANGGNLWLRQGSYNASALSLPPETAIHGGFAAGFDPEARVLAAGRSQIVGSSAQAMFVALGGRVTLDGLRFDAKAGATIAIDAVDTKLVVRGCEIVGCSDRGIRLRNSGLSPLRCEIIASAVNSNLADGLSASGAFSLGLFASDFSANVQEGVDIDDLVAPEGVEVRLVAEGCRFFANGSEGLDIDLAAPLLTGPKGARFVVDVRGCAFVDNALDGLLIDHDYETAAGWRSTLRIRESLARGNGRAGFHVDADGEGSLHLHRLLAAANRGDGIHVSSETRPGLAVVTSSIALNNQGYGVRASFGQVPILATHCISSGNRLGGFASDASNSASTSSIAHRQSAPWSNTHTFASVSSAADTFVNAALGYGRVLESNGSRVRLDGFEVQPNQTLELADNGIARRVVALDAGFAVLDAALQALKPPAPIALFAEEANVREDWRLHPDSSARGTGLRARQASAVDCGVWSAPLAGDPGFADARPMPFVVLEGITPSLPEGVASTTAIQLDFSTAVDAASFDDPGLIVRDKAQNILPVTRRVDAARLTLTPPAGGWPQPFVDLELHRSLRSSSGEPFVSPLAIRLTIR